MRALLLEDTHKFKMIEKEIPEPKEGEVRIKVLSAAICGSEIHGYHGKHFGRKAPAVMGHEVCGLVDAYGPNTTGKFPVGSRVVVLPQWTCNECRWCRTGHPDLCDKRVMLGFTKWPGGYQEYFIIPARLLFPISDVYTDQQGTLIEPFAVGIHGVRKAGVKMGDSVLVVGSGAIGLMATLAAKEAGATTIITTDILDYNLERAKQVGATHVFNSREGDMVEFVRSVTDGVGVDHGILCVAAPKLLDQTVQAVRKLGNIAIIASYTGPVTFEIEKSQLREQDIIGCVTYDEEDFRIATSLAEKVHPRIANFITHTFPIEQAPEAFDLVDKRKEDLVRVAFTF